MLRTGVIVQLLLALTLARGRAHPPRTVVDYYLLLPSGYFEGLATDTRSERMRLFRDFKGSFIDRQHGLLHIRGDGAQPDLNVSIFMRTERGAEGARLMQQAGVEGYSPDGEPPFAFGGHRGIVIDAGDRVVGYPVGR